MNSRDEPDEENGVGRTDHIEDRSGGGEDSRAQHARCGEEERGGEGDFFHERGWCQT